MSTNVAPCGPRTRAFRHCSMCGYRRSTIRCEARRDRLLDGSIMRVVPGNEGRGCFVSLHTDRLRPVNPNESFGTWDEPKHSRCMIGLSIAFLRFSFTGSCGSLAILLLLREPARSIPRTSEQVFSASLFIALLGTTGTAFRLE